MNTAHVLGALFVIAGMVTFAIFLMFGALGDQITKKMDEVAMRLIDEREKLELNRYNPEKLQQQTAELRQFVREIVGNPDFGTESRLAGAVVLMRAYYEALNSAAHAYKNAATELAKAEDELTEASSASYETRDEKVDRIQAVMTDQGKRLRELGELYRAAADEVEHLRSLIA